MSLIEKLTATEIRMIGSYIDNYAFRSASRDASVEYILRIWDENKSNYLNRIFTDSFIMSKPVEFHKGVDELDEELEKAIYGRDGSEEAKNFLESFYKNVVCKFDNRNPIDTNIYWGLYSLYNTHNLALNIFDRDTFELPVPNDEKPIKVQHGCKITKVLGKIAQAYNLPNYEEFRIIHSQILNQKKLKGTLNLSIHPLDYMTMSDNASGWSSCMSWEDDGCYRQGTVEMMNSPMVVVAYLRGSEDMHMPGWNPETNAYDFKWNNKKWRQLFLVSPEMIGNVKAYPYRNDSLTAEVLKWLKDLAEQAGIGHYTQNIMEYDTYREIHIDEFNIETCIHPMTYQMYNDFADSQFAFFGDKIPKESYRFYYSGPSECMCCGDTNGYFDGEGMLVCDNCERSYYCECCENNFYDEDDLQDIDGIMMCEDCIEAYCEEDDLDGELHHQDNMRSIFLSPNRTHYMSDRQLRIYEDNLDPYILKRYFKRIYKTVRRYNVFFFVAIDDCTEEGLELFGFKNAEEAYKDFTPLDSPLDYDFISDAEPERTKDLFHLKHYYNYDTNDWVVYCDIPDEIK